MKEMFKTVATFQYSSEALIIKGRLESEGIEVFMMDMHTIDTDPLVSNAIGGVKLRVRTEDENRTLEILESIQKYSLDDQGNDILCPNCQSHKIDFLTNIKDFRSLISFLFGFLFGALPFYTKYDYQCEACNQKFTIK